VHKAELFPVDPLGVLTEGHRRFGPVFRMPIDGVETVLVCTGTGPTELFALERTSLMVLNTPLVHDLFGGAVFNLTGDGHSEARRRLRPAISGRALACYAPILLEVAAPVAARWARHGGRDLHGQVRELTGAMCARILLGIPPGEPDALAFTDCFEDFVTATGVRPGRARYTTRRYWVGLRARRRLNDLFARRIERTRGAAPADSAIGGLAAAFDDAPAAAGMLEDHLLALLIAARETTASLITWALVELAAHREHALAAAAEARTAVVEPELLVRRNALAVLKSVLAETERLHSPNLLSMRETRCPVTVGGYGIPAGRRVAYSPSAGHFDTEMFTDPYTFRPQRFNADPTLRSRLWTFGGGAHACLGRPLAELMTLAVLAAVLSQGLPHLPDGPPTRIRHRPAKTPIEPLAFALEPES